MLLVGCSLWDGCKNAWTVAKYCWKRVPGEAAEAQQRGGTGRGAPKPPDVDHILQAVLRALRVRTP